jgi:hypothetical protein
MSRHRFVVDPEYCVEYHAHTRKCGPDICKHRDTTGYCGLPYDSTAHITRVDDFVEETVRHMSSLELNSEQAQALIAQTMLRWRKR